MKNPWYDSFLNTWRRNTITSILVFRLSKLIHFLWNQTLGYVIWYTYPINHLRSVTDAIYVIRCMSPTMLSTTQNCKNKPISRYHVLKTKSLPRFKSALNSVEVTFQRGFERIVICGKTAVPTCTVHHT